jgi:EAL domain-containing protein (putative c-di-GMP-specific phosphodiesterase class I)
LLRDPVSQAKVASIAQVAHKIGVRTVAELVESDELIARLTEMGIDYAEGFGISRPRALTASRASANGSAPAATRAPYSPRLWPMTMSGATP